MHHSRWQIGRERRTFTRIHSDLLSPFRRDPPLLHPSLYHSFSLLSVSFSFPLPPILSDFFLCIFNLYRIGSLVFTFCFSFARDLTDLLLLETAYRLGGLTSSECSLRSPRSTTGSKVPQINGNERLFSVMYTNNCEIKSQTKKKTKKQTGPRHVTSTKSDNFLLYNWDYYYSSYCREIRTLIIPKYRENNTAFS